MADRAAYPSDLTDAQWSLFGPFLDAWKARHPSVSGHEGRYELREIVNAILYQNRTGCQWCYLPHDLPPKSATYYYFALWRDDGTDQVIHDLLRGQVRERAGRAEDPSPVILDTQSIRAANHVPATTTGKDAGKKIPGRKRGLAIDALGLIIAVVITAASVTDTAIGVRLLDRVVDQARPRRGPGSTPGSRTTWPSTARSPASISKSSGAPTPEPGSFRSGNGGWSSRSNGTLMLHRRLVREYESRPASSVSRTLWASTVNMVRRLTGTTTPTWRGA